MLYMELQMRKQPFLMSLLLTSIQLRLRKVEDMRQAMTRDEGESPVSTRFSYTVIPIARFHIQILLGRREIPLPISTIATL